MWTWPGCGRTLVRAMLGLADRGRVLDLFDLIMKGDAAQALAELSGQYADGADPMAVLRDLAGINLVGGDVVEVSPPYDTTGATAIAGAAVAYELICLYHWTRKQG